MPDSEILLDELRGMRARIVDELAAMDRRIERLDAAITADDPEWDAIYRGVRLSGEAPVRLVRPDMTDGGSAP